MDKRESRQAKRGIAHTLLLAERSEQKFEELQQKLTRLESLLDRLIYKIEA